MSNPDRFWPTKIKTYDKMRAGDFVGDAPKPYTSLQDLVCLAVSEKLDSLEKRRLQNES